MKSVIQRSRRCFECGRTDILECHHVFYGTAYRRLSEKYGLKVWLCPEHHRGKNGVHGRNKALRLRLMRYAQRRFEETHTREEFMRLFGRNRLEEKAEERKGDAEAKADACGDSFGDDRNIPGWDC